MSMNKLLRIYQNIRLLQIAKPELAENALLNECKTLLNEMLAENK